ncbi:MAG TPA: nuclear transport factor 2 family protein [Gaiellaceae bacterium]|nr:nuclear transport factor 2 family protein [Gaiellaceae bacterium]
MPEHRNVDGIRRVFAAFLDGEKRALFEVIAEDAVWVVPGSTPVSKAYEGRERIFDLFRDTRRLTGQSYRSELRWCLADDEHGLAVYRARGRRLGRELDIDQALLIDLEDGRWRRIVAVPTDAAAFSSFWA